MFSVKRLMGIETLDFQYTVYHQKHRFEVPTTGRDVSLLMGFNSSPSNGRGSSDSDIIEK